MENFAPKPMVNDVSKSRDSTMENRSLTQNMSNAEPSSSGIRNSRSVINKGSNSDVILGSGGSIKSSMDPNVILPNTTVQSQEVHQQAEAPYIKGFFQSPDGLLLLGTGYVMERVGLPVEASPFANNTHVMTARNRNLLHVRSGNEFILCYPKLNCVQQNMPRAKLDDQQNFS